MNHFSRICYRPWSLTYWCLVMAFIILLFGLLAAFWVFNYVMQKKPHLWSNSANDTTSLISTSSGFHSARFAGSRTQCSGREVSLKRVFLDNIFGWHYYCYRILLSQYIYLSSFFKGQTNIIHKAKGHRHGPYRGSTPFIGSFTAFCQCFEFSDQSFTLCTSLCAFEATSIPHGFYWQGITQSNENYFGIGSIILW